MLAVGARLGVACHINGGAVFGGAQLVEVQTKAYDPSQLPAAHRGRLLAMSSKPPWPRTLCSHPCVSFWLQLRPY